MGGGREGAAPPALWVILRHLCGEAQDTSWTLSLLQPLRAGRLPFLFSGFPGASVTNHHEIRALRGQRWVVSQLWRPEVRSQHPWAPIRPSSRLPAFQRFSERIPTSSAPGGRLCPLACGCVTPHSAFVAMHPLLVWASPLKRTLVVAFRVRTTQDHLPTARASTKSRFPDEVTFLSSRSHRT